MGKARQLAEPVGCRIRANRVIGFACGGPDRGETPHSTTMTEWPRARGRRLVGKQPRDPAWAARRARVVDRPQGVNAGDRPAQ